jgi:hypothetical protein
MLPAPGIEPGTGGLKSVKLYQLVLTLRQIHLSYRGANKFLARTTSRCILFDG